MKRICKNAPATTSRNGSEDELFEYHQSARCNAPPTHTHICFWSQNHLYNEEYH